MPNRLAQETSPYLKQHADNPVDWHAWNPEALGLAIKLNKPILLSIGYSACHWCHVMAHESFEDTDIASLMNEYFINIKVDREERPDLDQVYQSAHYLLTRRNGGWPLTMFLTPDGTPFFGGTYFPKENRFNLPAFPDLLRRLAEVYAQNREELAIQNEQLVKALNDTLPKPASNQVSLNDMPIASAVSQNLSHFDSLHGGLGHAPKFLHPAELDLLLRNSRQTGDKQSRHVVLFTLKQMALGGLHDQLGGGFCRYSVDERWDIPHFEKMLYDNGLLLGLYCDAWQASGDNLFAHVVDRIAAWVMREMQSDLGGYYSSLDADSEHQEGKFYLWQREEVRVLLNTEEYAIVESYFGLDGPPNFEQQAWNLRVTTQLSIVSQRNDISLEQASALLEGAREKLFLAREKRIHPARDEKILGAWNALMITGMARAARVFNRKDWLHSAQRAMDFVKGTMWQEGRLLATYKDDKAHLNAYLDDHAFLLQASLELLQSEFRHSDLRFSEQIADALLTRFEDDQDGGFFFTSHDHEKLIQRNKIGPDNATPSGNGVAAQSLLRLFSLTGKTAYVDAAERCLKLFFPALQQAGGYYSSLCIALAIYLQPPVVLVLRGSHDATRTWEDALRTRYLPDMLKIVLESEQTDLPLALCKPVSEQVTAWLCHGTHCLPAIIELPDLLDKLS